MQDCRELCHMSWFSFSLRVCAVSLMNSTSPSSLPANVIEGAFVVVDDDVIIGKGMNFAEIWLVRLAMRCSFSFYFSPPCSRS